MVAVSERAKALLLKRKRKAKIADPEVGLRVTTGPSGQWILVADRPRSGDHVIKQAGTTVLLVGPDLQGALEGTEVVCMETFDGEVELALARAGTYDSEEGVMPKRIRDVMTSDPVTMPASATVLDAARRMRETSIGNVLVLNGNEICGIVTDRDLVVRALARERDPRSTTLADVCSRELTTVAPDDQIQTAVRLMRDKGIRRLPVVEGGRPVGILSIGDLAIERDRKSVLAAISAAPPNE